MWKTLNKHLEKYQEYKYASQSAHQFWISRIAAFLQDVLTLPVGFIEIGIFGAWLLGPIGIWLLNHFLPDLLCLLRTRF